MDPINAHSHLSYAKLYQQQSGPQSNPVPSQPIPPQPAIAKVAETQTSSGQNFSSLFADDELAKLQGNLEAISRFAETALKKIES